MKNVLWFSLLVGILASAFLVATPFMGLTGFVNAGLALAALSGWISALIIIQLVAQRSARHLSDIAGIVHSRPGGLLQNMDRVEAAGDSIQRRLTSAAKLVLKLNTPGEFTPPDSAADDELLNAILKIRKEIEENKADDARRNWIDSGISRFATLLGDRAEQNEYCYSIISNLVKYLGANQGGFYLERNSGDGRYLELVACYAYSKRRFVEKEIREGQGLLGQCMLEQDFLYLTDLPADFVKITSGLGEATPRSLVIVPLTFNGRFVGAMEIASFHELQPHHREFLRRVAENISSQMATLESVAHTQNLLDASRSLTLELRSREEEMQQNMEELVATQEAMERKQAELAGVINAIDATLGTAELDLSGKMVKGNGILLKILDCSSQQLLGLDFSILTGRSLLPWTDVASGKVKTGEFRTRNFAERDVWVSITFTSMAQGRILCMVQDITEKKSREQEIERLSLVANNTDNSVIITDGEGNIEYVNDGFVRMTGYAFAEVVGRKPGSFLQGPLTDPATIRKLSKGIRDGQPVYEEILNYHKNGHHYWVSLVINPVRDKGGRITRFISIQADITQTKIEALDFHQKMNALSRANAILEIDRNGFILHANDNYLRMTGFSQDELSGRRYADLQSGSAKFEQICSSLREGGFFADVVERLDKKGRRLSVKIMDYPVLNINGELEKVIEFAVDVSKEKVLENEAAKRQLELDSYLQGINNTIASAEFDRDGVFLDGNEIFLKVLGYGVDDLRDQKFDALMGDDPSVVMMWENLRLGKFFSGEFRMKNRHGVDLWLNGTFNPIMLGESQPKKIIMLAQFTTQEKEKVNDLTTFVQALKFSLPVIEFTPDFTCRTANEKAMRTFGIGRIAIRQKTILDFIAPFYHEEWAKKAAQIKEGECIQMVLPFSLGSALATYEVCLSVSRTLDGKTGKIVMILIKEVEDRISVMAVV